MEHFVLLYFKLLFLFIFSGAFCLFYFKLILLLFLVDHKKIKKREPKESINRSRRLEKERGSQIVEKRKKRKGEKGEFLRREKRESKT